MSNANNPESNDLYQVPTFTTTSAYASAETSPSKSITPSLSPVSLKNLNTNETTDLFKSANSSANHSFNDLNDQATFTNKEYQSLPHFSETKHVNTDLDDEKQQNVK